MQKLKRRSPFKQLLKTDKISQTKPRLAAAPGRAADIQVIKETRWRSRMNQVHLGLLLNVHWVTVSKWERGVGKPPSPWHMALIREIHEISSGGYYYRFDVPTRIARDGAIPTLLYILRQKQNPSEKKD